MKQEMQVIEKQTAWEGKFIRTVLLTYRDHAGLLRNWEAVERVNCHGITIVVPITKQGEFILIRQFRPVLDNFVIEFPAGLNNAGENAINTAGRELIEETGYTSEDLVLLAEGPVSSGMSTEILTVILALNAVPASSQLKEQNPPDETENIEVIRTPMHKVYETLDGFRERGDYIDLKIYGIIELSGKRAAAL